jgi:hypothetical protein
VKVDQFQISDDGTQRNLTPEDVTGKNIFKNAGDEEKSEYLVRVKWLKTVPLSQAIKEKGFFGNQNTVCKPMARKWNNTVERLKVRFGVK